MNVNLLQIKEIKNQDVVYGIFYCRYKELKRTRYGDSYISVGLKDPSGTLGSKVWKNSAHYESKFEEGDVVAVKGVPNLYRKKIELNISHIIKCDSSRYETYGFSSRQLISEIDCNLSLLWKKVCGYLKKTGANSKMIEKLYSDFKKEVFKIPYNVDVDCQIEGSYLNNLHRSLKVFDLLFNSSSRENPLDSELIYSLIFLKNFHVVTAYKKDVIYRMTEEALDRGVMSVFYDCLKIYKKFTDRKSFASLEKSIFEPNHQDFLLEQEIVRKVSALVEYVDS